MLAKTNQIHLMQWNVLSKNEKFCNSQSFPRVNEKDLKWENRSKLFKSILQELRPDLLCVEEIDDFEYFSNILKENYSAVCRMKKNNEQACVFFYDHTKFSILISDSHYLPLNDLGEMSGHIFLYSIVEDISSRQRLCVFITHLKSKEENESIRLSQIKHLMKFIDEDEVFLRQMEEFQCNSIILSGDLNTEPDWSCVPYLLDFKLTKNKMLKNLSFKSAYNISDRSKDDFLEMTTFKFRDTELCRVIDYVFFMGNVNSIKTSPTIKKSDSSFSQTDLKNTGLPNQNFPSDHFHLNFYFNLA
jgi:mRNA deadenylase 3'-5' endonuclease subunit Ccr4